MDKLLLFQNYSTVLIFKSLVTKLCPAKRIIIQDNNKLIINHAALIRHP